MQISIRANWTGTLDYEIALGRSRTLKRIGWGDDGYITLDRLPNLSFQFEAALLQHPLVRGALRGQNPTATYRMATNLTHKDFLECCLEIFQKNKLNVAEQHALLQNLHVWVSKPESKAMAHRTDLLAVVEAVAQLKHTVLIRIATRIQVAISPLKIPSG